MFKDEDVVVAFPLEVDVRVDGVCHYTYPLDLAPAIDKIPLGPGEWAVDRGFREIGILTGAF